MTQLSLTKEQALRLEAIGIDAVVANLEAGAYGSYRRQLVESWLEEEKKKPKPKPPEVPIPKRKFSLAGPKEEK